MSQADQQDLLQRAVRGDQAALEQLLLAHYDRLHRFLAKKLPISLRAKLDAEDILQQTYIEAFRDFPALRLDSPESLKRWLTSIADHRLLDAIKTVRRKKRGGEHRRVNAADQAATTTMADLLELLAGDDRTPSQQAAGAEGVKALQLQLAGLPEEYREVVRLRHLEGKSLEEVARATGQTVDQVRGLLYRAKKKLRDGMGRSSLYFSKG